MISVIPYNEGDAYRVKPRKEFGVDESIADRTNDNWGKPGVFMHTFIDSERVPVAILGGTVIWSGVMEVWTIISDQALRHPISFHKKTLQVIETYESLLKLFRIQMTIRADFDVAQEWSLRLGFKPEARLEKYGPDMADYYMFARFA